MIDDFLKIRRNKAIKKLTNPEVIPNYRNIMKSGQVVQISRCANVPIPQKKKKAGQVVKMDNLKMFIRFYVYNITHH